jgi:hypothetical protein
LGHGDTVELSGCGHLGEQEPVLTPKMLEYAAGEDEFEERRWH